MSTTTETCPDGPHRGPQGPNEDLGQCQTCKALSYRPRPTGETYGHHSPDCSLPEEHQSYCQPGGAGHSPAPTVRGYWPLRVAAGTGRPTPCPEEE
jgi:hypothetical protein